MNLDSDKISALLIECSERYILPRYKKLKDKDIRTKTSPTDLVTQADLDVEEYLTRILPGLLPGSIVVGEEAVSGGAIALDAMKTDGPVWVIDPVDGTNNFVQGGDQFGILLALVDKGVTQAGWIYDVTAKEMTVVQRGQGAFTEGRRLKISAPAAKLSELSGYLPLKATSGKLQEELKEAKKLLKNTQPLFSAVHIYLSLVKNDRQFSIMTAPKPWDHLAGVLMVEEAGGYTAKWNGTPYMPQDDTRHGVVAAASKEIWDLIFNKFIKKFI
jgi:fructose-1,6-bisphosphatase/inositol monophosphatase family enzyme